MRKKSCRGVTMIELLVTLLLIALVSSIVGPAIASRIDNIYLQSAATQLAAQLRKAQALARYEQAPIVMTYVEGEFRFYEQSGEQTRAVGGYRLPSSISLISTVSGGCLFLPSGQIVGPGELQLRNARGRIARIEADFLNGIVVAAGGLS